MGTTTNRKNKKKNNKKKKEIEKAIKMEKLMLQI